MKRFKVSLGHAVRLWREDGLGIIHTAGIMAAVRVALWCLPFRIVYAHLQKRKWRFIKQCKPSHTNVSVRHIIQRIQRASRIVPRATCLVQGLAAEQFLARAGYVATLRIGVARAAGKQLLAHAWVEYNGEVVLGATGYDQFTALPPLER
jgi:hypothetical protein